MVVCHCKVVNDRRIGELIASGATTVDEITARCGAGGRCGGCVEVIVELLGRHLDREAVPAA